MSEQLWPHQTQAVYEFGVAAQFHKRLLLTSPTGGGKTRIVSEIIRGFLERDEPVVVYGNRKLLIEQTSTVLAAEGHEHGVRAAGHEQEQHRLLQVSSIPTELTRSLKTKEWRLHKGKLAVFDEAHLHTGPTARRLMEQHLDEDGAVILGVTATPIGLGHLYEYLIVAGTNSQLRACGALVPCLHYGCDEPDLHGFKQKLGEDVSEKENVSAIMRPGIFGRVMEWYRRLNPDGRPTILFAPGVAESLWFAEQFHSAGVSAAHIDAQDVWINGERQPTSPEARAELLQRSRSRSVAVVCNRFVLREGIDAPWLSHGILACVLGSLQSYLQAGGRLLRAEPGLQRVTIQDHGGNWWRHGSLNADRLWDLNAGPAQATGTRQERIRNGKEGEPVVCPHCGLVLNRAQCLCGFVVTKRSRPVIQSDGQLVEMEGRIFKPRQICKRANGAKLWEKMYHRACTAKGRTTFRGAAARFAKENYWKWPDPRWPFMPLNESDWFQTVADVPRDRLTT
jgi:DNA repair protein RadD